MSFRVLLVAPSNVARLRWCELMGINPQQVRLVSHPMDLRGYDLSRTAVEYGPGCTEMRNIEQILERVETMRGVQE